MDKIILIKYGELTTKKGNRKQFIDTLYKNINKKLEGLNVIITSDMSRMYIEFKSENEEQILKRIKEIFGIHAFLIAYKETSNLDSIKYIISEIIDKEYQKDNYTFKIETKRSDKKFFKNSMECNYELGSFILKKYQNFQVDVHNPDLVFHVEIRSDYSYIYLNEIEGLGGYPVGTLGRGLLMLSGGIDSPVAGYLSIKRGVKLDLVYFEAIPHTSIEARNKVIELAKKLAVYGGEMRLIIVPFTKLQENIYKYSKNDYPITIMRRMMYRIMEKLSIKYKGLAIINGESIGQVASQTLSSMNVINNVTSFPIIRPVACFDKLEIIDIAKKIDTYDISILPYEDCCTVFVPKHPVINPDINVCIEIEKKFDYKSMIDELMNNLIILNISENYNDSKYDDIL